MPIRVIIVDDDPIVRQAIIRTVTRAKDLQVVGVAGTGKQAVELASSTDCDVIVMDVKLPDFGGDEATKRILKAKPSAKVLGLTAFRDPATLRKMVFAGVSGFLFKPDDVFELLNAIRAVAAGESYFFAKDLVPTILAEEASNSETKKLFSLTAREREIVELRVQGWQNFSIARKLGVGESTVSGHFSSAMTKLSCSNFAELVLFAQRTNIIP